RSKDCAAMPPVHSTSTSNKAILRPQPERMNVSSRGNENVIRCYSNQGRFALLILRNARCRARPFRVDCMIRVKGLFALFALAVATIHTASRAQAAPEEQGSKNPKQLVILDTDIGDDIDDAFALALVLRSPEVQLLGITTDFGDTELRARLVDRYLTAIGRSDIPVCAGKPTPHSNVFTQATYAEHEPARQHRDGVQFLLDQIKAHPGQITLIAIGPFVDAGEAIKRDPETFRKLKRVVVMGGSVYRGYDTADSNHTAPQPEWNIARDPEGAMALLAAGVPVYMMPLDSTQIHLDEADRERLFAYGSPLTDQLTLLYHQWVARKDYPGIAPTLFDPVAAAF